MRAIVYHEYGPPDVLRAADVDEPVAGADEVLVRIHAASVNPADWHFMRGEPRIARLSFGLRRPKENVLGCDLAGQVEAVGDGVTAFQPGDEVFGCSFMGGLGAFAERGSIAQQLLAEKPANLSFQQAAAVPLAGMTAVQGLRDHGRVEPGHNVLIVGAAGGVGSFAVQVAKHLGAEVTGVCSTGKADLVRSLGADHVIDYAHEDSTQGGQRYDLIFQLAGTHSPAECRRALAPKGKLLLSSGESTGRWIGPLSRTLKALLMSPFVSERLIGFTMKPSRDDLNYLKELIDAGTVTPVIDRTYPLAEVPDAIRYLEEGHARGKIVIGVG